MLPKIDPIIPILQKEPFSDPEWLFEVKYDGFRAIAYIEDGLCKFVSRKDNTFDRFKRLGKSIASALGGTTAIIDGEIVCLDENGRSLFYDLMKGGIKPSFCAFDLLHTDGLDLQCLPLIKRKEKLRQLLPEKASKLLYVDHILEKGEELFKTICEWDLEGIVAKPGNSTYNTTTKWIKIKNPHYSQTEGRQELFDPQENA